VTVGLIAMFGGYRVSGFGSVFGSLAIFGTMAAVATVEELLFRGIVFRLVEELVGTRGALVASSLLFGLLHLVNPGATLWGALAIAVEAGLMLGAAYAAMRSLWPAIGIHLGWNFVEAGIFGATVSGSDHGPAGLLTASLPGPAALTGGGFGPEASLLALVVCTVPTVLFLRIARRRGLVYRRRRAAAGSA
jgi:membrane protease YdiL (CAAX protease family)